MDFVDDFLVDVELLLTLEDLGFAVVVILALDLLDVGVGLAVERGDERKGVDPALTGGRDEGRDVLLLLETAFGVGLIEVSLLDEVVALLLVVAALTDDRRNGVLRTTVDILFEDDFIVTRGGCWELLMEDRRVEVTASSLCTSGQNSPFSICSEGATASTLDAVT